MILPLIPVQQAIENSIENAIYLILLENGLTPDRDLFASDSKGYEAAKTQILQSKKICVDLYGHGAPQDRDVKKTPRITVTGLGFLFGDTGDFQTYYDKVDGAFSLFKPTTVLSNYRFQVTLTSDRTSHDRILESVRQMALPNMDYIKYYVDPKSQDAPFFTDFLIRYAYTKQSPDLSFSFIEKSYIYEAVDIQETPARVVKSKVSPIKEITVKDYDGDTIEHKQSVVVVVNENEQLGESSNTILN